MRMSRLFGHTLREPPADAEAVSHQLLARGGYVRPLAAGVYSYMPLGLRVIRRLEALVGEEMNRVGGQEMLMPLLVPAALWESTGRWEEPAPMRSQDRTSRYFSFLYFLSSARDRTRNTCIYPRLWMKAGKY